MQSTAEKNNILIVAAEASSALYAERLLEELKRRKVHFHAFGVGSRSMQEKGFEAIGRSENMAVVGVQEVLKHYKDIRNVFWNLVKAAQEKKPQFALLLDYPDFNLRLAKELKNLGIQVVYYISPQVWAWRKSRIKLIKKYVDEMLVLFPFEKDFYEKNGVNVHFVGHPLLDELKSDNLSSSSREEMRARLGVGSSDILLGLMPGSRYSELKHHLSLQIRASELVQENIPNIKVALLVAPSIQLDAIRQSMPRQDYPLRLIQDDPIKMISACDVVLSKSGTGSLLVGMLKKPMVIIYRMNRFSALLARLFVKIQNFGMVNLILKKNAVPELFQEEANEKNIADHLVKLITDKDYQKQMIADLSAVVVSLGDGGATARVVDRLMRFFK